MRRTRVRPSPPQRNSTSYIYIFVIGSLAGRSCAVRVSAFSPLNFSTSAKCLASVREAPMLNHAQTEDRFQPRGVEVKVGNAATGKRFRKAAQRTGPQCSGPTCFEQVSRVINSLNSFSSFPFSVFRSQLFPSTSQPLYLSTPQRPNDHRNFDCCLDGQRRACRRHWMEPLRKKENARQIPGAIGCDGTRRSREVAPAPKSRASNRSAPTVDVPLRS